MPSKTRDVITKGKSCDAAWHRLDEEKDMAFTLIFLGLISVPYCLSLEPLAGGIQDRKPDDPDVLDALDFAMNEFNAMQNNLYRLMSTKVKDATVQVKTQLCLDRFKYIRITWLYILHPLFILNEALFTLCSESFRKRFDRCWVMRRC